MAPLAGCTASVPDPGSSSDVTAGTGGAPAAQLEPVATTLAPGLRAAVWDSARRVIWVLTRTDRSQVLLDELDPTSGSTTSLTLPRGGKDWLNGAILVRDGIVWAAWGTALVEYDPSSGAVQVHAGDWRDQRNGLTGLAVSMAADDRGCIVVAVAGDRQLHCWQTATTSWTGLQPSTAAVPGPGTRLATCAGVLAVNLADDSTPVAMPVSGSIWLVPQSSVVQPGEPGTCYVVSATSIRRVRAGEASTATTYSGPAGPVWSVPMTWTSRGIAFVRESVGAVTVVVTDAGTGAEVPIAVPLRRFTEEPRPGSTGAVVSFADPCLVALVSPGDARLWAVSCLNGSNPAPAAYPALWSVRT